MKKRLYNIDLDILSTQEFLKKIDSFFKTKTCNTVAFLNAHCFNIAQKNKNYLEVISHTSIVLNDGIGIKIACLLNGFTPKENMNGTDLIPKIVFHTSELGKSTFLLGGEEGIADSAKKKLASINPKTNIAGTHSGFFSTNEEDELIHQINNSKAEVLIIGMGVPKQEIWAYENADKFENIKVIVSGGAILDFLADRFKRAPKFIQILGLEWVIRLIQEPTRLAKRYLIGNFIFLSSVLFYRIFKR